MRLDSRDGSWVELAVTGYQFPDAADIDVRCSWHTVAGAVSSSDGEWRFRWQALTCDESGTVGTWLRAVADQGPPREHSELVDSSEDGVGAVLAFTEPNLALRLMSANDESVQVQVTLSQEFSPPWLPQPWDTYELVLDISRPALLAASRDWDRDVAAYPDNSTPPERPTAAPSARR